jgi:hypothetical protein
MIVRSINCTLSMPYFNLLFYKIDPIFSEAVHGVLYVSSDNVPPGGIQECHIYIYQTMSCFQPG